MAYSIRIRIEHHDRVQAIEALKKILNDIEKGIVGCSRHDDSYMPYVSFSCNECDADAFKQQVNRETGRILAKFAKTKTNPGM